MINYAEKDSDDDESYAPPIHYIRKFREMKYRRARVRGPHLESRRF